MKTVHGWCIACVVILGLLVGPVVGQTVRVGEVAPNFTIVNHDSGAEMRMTDFAGKVLVLDFFAYWCGSCQVSSPQVERDIQQYYASRGGNGAGVPVIVLPINIDQSNRVQTDAFIRNAGLGLTGDDIYGQAWRQHDTGGIPTFVILNGVSGAPGMQQWQVLYRQAGYAGYPALRQVIETVRAPAQSAAPTITNQPVGQSVLSGQPASLSVIATGWPSPTYQWHKDGIAIGGATGSSLGLAQTSAADAASYYVVVRNSAGSVTSSTATLKVVAAVVSPEAKEVGAGRTTYQIAINSGENWLVSRDTTWVTASKNSGVAEANLDLVVEPNPGSADRTAVVTIGGFEHRLTQKGAGSAYREMWAVGGDSFGQLADVRLMERHVPVNVGGNVRQAAAGVTHALFVKNDGTLWAMGSNSVGQLGDGTTINRMIPVPMAAGVQAVAAGSAHTLFLKTDGSLWAVGSNTSGQLGTGSTTSRVTPVQIASGVQAIAAANSQSFFVKADGSLWAAGYNYYGQLGDGTTANRTSAVQIATGVQSVAAGNIHTLFVKGDGTLWAMGYNYSGQLGDGSTTNRSTPVQVATGVRTATAGSVHSLFLKSDGSLWGMGYNYYGQLGDGSNSSQNVPVQITTGVQSVVAGGFHTLFLKADGSFWGMGRNNAGQLGDGSTSNTNTPVRLTTGISSAAPGDDFTLWIKTDGSLWGMGSNDSGQLGDGTIGLRTAPVQVAANVQTVSAGYGHSLLVKNDRTLWAAGYNTYGQSGGSEGASRSSWVQIDTEVQAAAAGAYHNLLLKTDGALWAMGYNYYGQLGDASTTTRTTPVLVSAGVKATAAGYYHSLFVKSDDSLWAVGRNYYGQLGDGTTTDRNTPVQVATGVQAASAGYGHSLFLKTDGTLWAMGYNTSGQLGDGSSTQRITPVQITSGVRAIAAGYFHSLFLKTDGTLWAMGYNSYGQLGNGSTANRTAPVQVATGVQAVAAGYYHSLFTKTDGSLWGMGANDDGELADGSTINRSTPVRMAGGVVAMAGGADFTLFITQYGLAGGSPQITTQPTAQSAAPGGSVTFTVAAGGMGTLSYQWRKDGVALAGATGATLTLANLSAAQAGSYDVVVTNVAGTVTSQAAVLSLRASRIANLSVRTNLSAGQTLTVGFTTSGSKRLLARAVGPSLYTVAGLTGFLPDPRLALINQSTGAVVAQNDNWDAGLSATAASLGAFPMDVGGKDSALLQAVSGGYTAQINGTGAGIVLVEVYDAESSSTARLTNVSARNLVGTGDNILIAGFVIDGAGEKALLIRGIGPALRDLWGVSGVLADPKLEVLKSDGTKLAENDNWATALGPVFDRVGAFRPLAGSRDAALQVSLPPGAYTVQLSGVGNVTGDGVIEIYEL